MWERERVRVCVCVCVLVRVCECCCSSLSSLVVLQVTQSTSLIFWCHPHLSIPVKKIGIQPVSRTMFVFSITSLKILTACLIFVYIWLHWVKQHSSLKPLVHKILFVAGNLFIFGIICYFYPGSHKNQHLSAQCKQIPNELGVFLSKS